ncbi:hypothetical protein U5B43_08795 [Campylobacter sp. 9BO]|uniref:hypothetical protein n=1 Tax=Campylobacter sp. 9BO TaxID=3424759 RepID=UPI003D348804
MINVGELINDPDFCQSIQRGDEVFTAVVQYLSHDEMQILPQGERFNEYIRIDTQFSLNLGDVIIWQQNEYRVKAMQDWGQYGYKNYTAVKFNELEKRDSAGFELT